MTEKEAIKKVKEFGLHHAIGDLPDSALTVNAFEMAIAALEKQMPKKPNITTGKADTDKLACCPTCDSNVDWTYEGFWRYGKRKYCHECGQAIDWSE